MRLSTTCPALRGLAATGVHAHCDMGGCIVPDRGACREEHAAIQEFWEPTHPMPFMGDIGPDVPDEPETNHPWDWFSPPAWLSKRLVYAGVALGVAYGLYRYFF